MFLEIIVVTIFIATIFNIVLNRFNTPTIIGYIITGKIIAYIYWLQEVSHNQDLKTIAEFWLVFLMFTIWLEFSFNQLLKMKKNVFVLWSLQFFITTIIFYLLAETVFWIPEIESLIIWLALSLSSTAVVLKLLNESWEINKHYWNRAVGILLFQDLMVIPILILISVFSSAGTAIPELVTKTFISAIVLIVTLWFMWKYLLDIFLYKVAKTKSNEIFIWSILFIVIWSSVLAHMLGFTYSLWAFIAWVLIAETHYKHQVEADLIPFRDLLLGFFFVTVGMQLDLEIIYGNLFTILILLTWLILVKISLMHFIITFFHHQKSAFKTALSLFQFWEFWIVVLQIAMFKIWFNESYGNILISVIILSMLLTPLILKHVSVITDFLFWVKHNEGIWENIWENSKNHVVLIWFGRLWKLLACHLENHNLEYVIIENDIKTYREAKKAWKPIIFGNAFQANTLKSVWIESASAILISVGKSEKLFLISNVVKKMNIDGKVIVKVNNFDEESMLRDLNINDIIVETDKTALAMIRKVPKKRGRKSTK